MITTGFIKLAIFLLSILLFPFPSSSGFPSQVDSAIAVLGGYIGILAPIVPIATMGTIISLIITFELTVFAFKSMKWLISHVPFVGGKG